MAIATGRATMRAVHVPDPERLDHAIYELRCITALMIELMQPSIAPDLAAECRDWLTSVAYDRAAALSREWNGE